MNLEALLRSSAACGGGQAIDPGAATGAQTPLESALIEQRRASGLQGRLPLSPVLQINEQRGPRILDWAVLTILYVHAELHARKITQLPGGISVPITARAHQWAIFRSVALPRLWYLACQLQRLQTASVLLRACTANAHAGAVKSVQSLASTPPQSQSSTYASRCSVQTGTKLASCMLNFRARSRQVRAQHQCRSRWSTQQLDRSAQTSPDAAGAFAKRRGGAQ